MHNNISDEVVKHLNKLAHLTQTRNLREALHNLSTNHKNEYIKHVKEKPQGSRAMTGILNALEDKSEALSIFNQLPQEFAFNTLDCIHPTNKLFKTLFKALDRNEYIKHVKEKPQGSSAMAGILNALEDKSEALSIFNQLPQEFAFNTLDCIHPTHKLFKTLFHQLNLQQKEDYKVHLETKTTVKAKFTLKNFYSSNKESSSNLSTENSNEPLVQNRDDLPSAHFSPISPAFEETVVEHPLDTRLELSSDKEDQSCSQTVIPFPGFAEFDNQLRNTVTEDSTVSSSLTSNENISDSLESELTSQLELDSQINGGEPSQYLSAYHILTERELEEICTVTVSSSTTSNENISDSLEGEQLSPEYYNYLINGVVDLQSSIVDELPELNFSPISPASEGTVAEYAFDTRPDFSYDNESLVHKRKRDYLNEFSELSPENFFLSSVTLEEIVGKYEFDTGIDEICTVEPPAKRQCISVPSFPGFAEFHNQFSNMVTEDSTVSSSLTSNENISDSLESELTSQLELDSQINGVTSLQFSMFDRLGNMEEVHIEQPAKFQTTITSLYGQK